MKKNLILTENFSFILFFSRIIDTLILQKKPLFENIFSLMPKHMRFYMIDKSNPISLEIEYEHFTYNWTKIINFPKYCNKFDEMKNRLFTSSVQFLLPAYSRAISTPDLQRWIMFAFALEAYQENSPMQFAVQRKFKK